MYNWNQEHDQHLLSRTASCCSLQKTPWWCWNTGWEMDPRVDPECGFLLRPALSAQGGPGWGSASPCCYKHYQVVGQGLDQFCSAVSDTASSVQHSLMYRHSWHPTYIKHLTSLRGHWYIHQLKISRFSSREMHLSFLFLFFCYIFRLKSN